MKTRIIGASLLALAGCTASYTEPSLDADNPARPDAAAAPIEQRSGTLDLAGVDPVSPARGGMNMEHGGADAGTSPTDPGGGDNAHQDHGGSGSANPSASPAALYACPMHPEVTSDKPDQRCPKCGMKLVKAQQTGGRQ